jgi:phage portal protein BeeE
MGLFSRKSKAVTSEQTKESTLKDSTKSEGAMTRGNTNRVQYLIGASRDEKKFNSKTLLVFYETVSQVNSIINFISEKCSEIPIKHFKYLANGKRKWLGETEVQKLIDILPIHEAATQLQIHGNVYLLKKYTPGFLFPTGLDVLPADRMYAIPLHSIDQYGTPSTNQDVFNNPIIRYSKQLDDGSLINYKKEEIIHIRDINPSKTGLDFYYGASRLYAASRSINVLANIYDTINTILAAKGALGFISRNSKTGEVDPLMYQELMDEVERRINEDFGTTGDRRSIMVTGVDARWNRMDSPVNDFMPVELNAQEFSQLCNQLRNVPDILFNSKGNAHYNNWKEAEKAMYVNCVLPLVNTILTAITKDLKINISGEWIEADDSEIPAMQTDDKTNAEAKQVEINYLEKMLNKNLVTKNQVLELMGFPTVNQPEFNEYKEAAPIPVMPVQLINDEEDGDEE